MGSGSFDSGQYRDFAASTATKTTDQIYASRALVDALNPLGVRIRESRDSADNPVSTPIIVGIDVTGSMGMIADALARQGLGALFGSLLSRGVVPHPHLMFMAIGDVASDRAPLQVSQFEADNRIVEQLTQIFLEKGGGGNQTESYDIPWYFAARHTEHDSLAKRGKRGYLFTVGDEEAPHGLSRAQIKRFIGDDAERDVSPEDGLRDAQRAYEVFHIVITEGDYARQYLEQVLASWRPLLGPRVIVLDDYTKVAETVSAAIEMAEGHPVNPEWDTVVRQAVANIPPSALPVIPEPSTPAASA